MIENSKFPFAVLVTFFMISSIFIGTSLDSSNITFLNLNRETHIISSTSSIVIDGNLSTNEWSNAVHKVQWYMDADPENSDGFNYMYIDEDPWNLYIALDLCSDQTNDNSGEWVGLWLNTNETDFYNEVWETPLEWEAALDKGCESLLHDVENDKTIEYFTELEPVLLTYRYLPEPIVFNGSYIGTQNDIMWDDLQYLNMTSEFNGTHHIYRFDADFNFFDVFNIFEELYFEHLQRVEFQSLDFHNVTIDEFYLCVTDEQGNLISDMKTPMATSTSEILNSINIYNENFTTESNLRLSIQAINDAPFKTSFDYVAARFFVDPKTDIAVGTVLPYASIRNYEIAWAYGPTENNASDHRSFEFRIPKSELEGYEMETNLGIIAGGYGTLASWPNTHNWVLSNGVHPSFPPNTGIPEEGDGYYLYYSMPMKGWTPPSAPILDAISPDPDSDGNVLVNWNDDIAVENWTVYRHSSLISEANLESATEIATGLTESEYNDIGLTDGIYWYAVAAIGPYGYSYLSNSVSVTVEFPVTTPTTPTIPTTPTTPSPIDQNLIIILGGAGAVVLLVILIVVIKKR